MEDEKDYMPKDGEPTSDYSRFMPGAHRSEVEETVESREERVERVEVEETIEETVESRESRGERTERTESEETTETDRTIWAKISHLISWLMVPMLMPVYGILLIFGLSILNFTSAGTRLVFASIIFGVNVAIPAIIIVVLKRIGVVQDLGLNGRKERLIPYIVSIAALCVTAWFLADKQAPAWAWLFYIGGAIGGVINLIVNCWWKISAHAAGVAGIVALLVRIGRDGIPQGDLMLWLLIWILLAGLTGSARLYLRRHTFWQVMAGYAVGFLSVYLATAL